MVAALMRINLFWGAELPPLPNMAQLRRAEMSAIPPLLDENRTRVRLKDSSLKSTAAEPTQ
jgi:hypothetical protein